MSRFRRARYFALVGSACLLAILPAGGATRPQGAADLARATLLAQLGLQDAEAKLKAYFPFRAFDTPRPPAFWAGDKTETVEPPLGSLLENAVNPSFAVEADGDPDAGSVAPRTLRIAGAERGYSGTAGPGTYAANGDQYALRVSDLSGRLFVNDGLDGGSGGSVSQNLRRILNVLGATVSVSQLGDRLLAARPPGGYRSLSELQTALGSPQDFDRVKELVTVHAWVDRHVANPVPLSAAKAPEYPVTYYRGSSPLYRHGSAGSGLDSAGNPVSTGSGLQTCPQACAGAPHDSPLIRLYGLDTLNPQWVEIVSRAPVNVNAARREVLVALLTDLKGFFVADRRRNNPRWQGELLVSFRVQNTFSPSGTEGDEIGFLMETEAVVGPGGAATSGISAFVLADEIIACRERRASANFDYASVPWSGPFRTWRQFHQFVDNLAVPKAEFGAGVLDDPRPLHFDYDEFSVDPTGYGALVPSAAQRRHAVRALADVIKANFNPNLHLNETNPDENLYFRVDKTDLIVNSTEFCLLPTGYFEVESVGRTLRPTDASSDALLAADNEVMGQATRAAVFRLYDLYRETNHRQFYAGTASARAGPFESNNDLSLEVGPEPDNGVFPGNLGAPGVPDNEWDGYVAFPTVGGVFGGHGSSAKAKNTLARTLDLLPRPHLNSAVHVHFTLDSDACDHAVDRQEIASRTLVDEVVVNYPDWVGGGAIPYGGPYDPTKGPAGAHRVCRSFRGAPALAPYAPSDLRIDGLHSERHAAPAYYVHKGAASLWNFSAQNASGLVSFWFKPSFFPDLTGKIRKPWDMSRYHTACLQNLFVWPFEMMFLPTNYSAGLGGISENSSPRFWNNNMGQFHPCSFYWGSMQWHSDNDLTLGGSVRDHRFGKLTVGLNHRAHDDCEQLNRTNPAAKPSPFQAHRWMNAGFAWTLNGTWDSSGFLRTRMFVNGVASSPGSPYIPFSFTSMTGGWAEGYDRMNGFERHTGGEFNHMRLGAPSRIAGAAVAPSGAFRGNHTADGTVDELYVWRAEADGDPLLLWLLGRYYKPTAAGEGAFTSQPIALPPAGAGSPVRVLGASWTWYGEDVDWTAGPGGKPRLYDYKTPLGVAETRVDVLPLARLGIRDGALVYGLFDNDAFSRVLDSGGVVPILQDPSQVRYVAQFQLGNAAVDTILLATPVLDDVTLYWHDGRSSTRLGSAGAVALTGPSTLADGVPGQPYSAQFTASASGVVTWSVLGTLPPGMALDPATGLYSGTPTTAGPYTFVVVASDGTEVSGAEYTHTIGGGPGGGGGCGALGLEALLLVLLGRRRVR